MTEKPRRTKEEIAAAREERIAAMRSKCAVLVGVPCRYGCERGCHRNKLAKTASRNRIAKSKAARDAMADSIDRRQKAREKAERDRLAAIRKVEKKNHKLRAEVERWQVEVLYLAGHNVKQIAQKLYGSPANRVGPINRIVTQRKLVAALAAGNIAQRLIDLDARKPKDIPHGYVKSAVAHGPDQKRAARLYDEIVHLLGLTPELVVERQSIRGAHEERVWNVGASALHVAARGGAIQEWNVAAGMMLQSCFQRMQGGGIGSIDFTKDIVDGSGPAGVREAAIDAGQRFSRARREVESAFRVEGTAPWRWAIIDHVVLQEKPLRTFAFPAGMTSAPALFLNDALLPLAIFFKTAPSGILPPRPDAYAEASHELRTAMARAAQARLEDGTLAASVPAHLRDIR